MKRGDLVTVSLSGDYGKPRPALVVQAGGFDYLESMTVLPLTSDNADSRDLRILVHPTDENGLRDLSFVMIDKISSVRRLRVGRMIGSLDSSTLAAVDRALATFLGFA